MTQTDNRLSRRDMMKTSLAAAAVLTSTSESKAVTKVKNAPVRLGGPVFEKYRDPDVWVAALKKLSVHNLSNLMPHPLYVFLNYSHPPVLQRVRDIRELSAES